MLAYLLFVAGIVFLIIKANNEKFDLVTDNYYEEEIKYQQVIDAAGQTAKLSGKLEIKKQEDKIVILFPSDFTGKKVEGELHMYYAANEKKDFKQPVQTDKLEWSMVLPMFATGQYTAKLSWVVDGKKYYFEKNIFL